MKKVTVVILSILLATTNLVSCSNKKESNQNIDFTTASEEDIKEYLKTVDNDISSYSVVDELSFDLEYDFIEMDTANGGTLKQDLEANDADAQMALVIYGLSPDEPWIQQTFIKTDKVYYDGTVSVIDRKMNEKSMNAEWDGAFKVYNDTVNKRKFVSEGDSLIWNVADYISEDVNYALYYIGDDFLTSITNITVNVNENEVTLTGSIKANKTNIMSPVLEVIDFSSWGLADTDLPITIVLDQSTNMINSVELDMKDVIATLFPSDNTGVNDFLNSESCKINKYIHKFTYKDYNSTTIDKPAGLPEITSADDSTQGQTEITTQTPTESTQSVVTTQTTTVITENTEETTNSAETTTE